MNNCMIILGPTASGKTALACKLAHVFGGEVISADSRQVYKELNLGVGKDLEEYLVAGTQIPYHNINVLSVKEQYYLHDFVRDAHQAFTSIIGRDKLPIVCGGTGLYLDSFHKRFDFTQVAEDHTWRAGAESLSKAALVKILESFPIQFTKHVDRQSTKRLIRGIEVARYRMVNDLNVSQTIPYQPLYIGTHVSRELRHELIHKRLEIRLSNGLIEEVEQLLHSGVSEDRLYQLGLEYRFVLGYIQGQLSMQAMKDQLATAINQFSRRQMTWFRKMEKEGIKIHWLDMQQPLAATEQAIQLVKQAFSL